MNVDVKLVNPRLPLQAQRPPGWTLQFLGQRAVFAATVIPGSSALLKVKR